MREGLRGSVVSIAMVACSMGTATDGSPGDSSTTGMPATALTQATAVAGADLGCDVWNSVMEPSAVGFPTARAAVEGAVQEAGWHKAVVREARDNEWLGHFNDRVVLRVKTVSHEDGSWDFEGLEYC